MIERCTLPSWIHLLPQRTQNARREGESTTTTRADSQTGHLTIPITSFADH